MLNNAITAHLCSVYNINPICKYQIQVCSCHVSNSVSAISHFLPNRFKHLECQKRYRCKKEGKALPSPWMLPALHLWFSRESLALISQQLLYLCSFRGGDMVQSSLQRISSWNRNYKGGLAAGYELTNLLHRHCIWQASLAIIVAENHTKSLTILCYIMPQVISVQLFFFFFFFF